MATAALINPEIRIAPFAETDFAGLEAIFNQQCDEWLALLRWDYSGPSRLIREVVSRQELPGFVAMTGCEIVGFAFYVVEGNRCSIGDIYVSKLWRAAGADRQLIQAILDKLAETPRLRRIESQCVSIENHGADKLLEELGFERFERHYLMMDLKPRGEPRHKGAHDDGQSEKLEDVFLRAWRPKDFTAASRIICRSYRGEYDSRINKQYATEEGCAELLYVLTEQIWCGEFLPQASRVAVSRSTGKKLGLLIASRIAEGSGHISQISILPDYQGRGIGRAMIGEALAEFERRRFDCVSLAVTSANEPAYHLYRSCGFRTVHTFPVFFREGR